MNLNRELQKAILVELKNHYPNDCAVKKMVCYTDGQEFNGNIIYLEEHGLVSGKTHISRSLDDAGPHMLMAKITAHGLDFIEDDGGLRAILNKLTIKFDSEDINSLITAHLDRTNIPPEKKNEIISTLKSLPSEGIKTVYKHLINYALGKTPDVIDLIQIFLSQSP